MLTEKKIYQVMNKDTIILEQEVEFVYNKYGKRTVRSTKMLESYTDIMPFGYTSFEEWVTRRITATQRMDVRQLLNLLGLFSIYDFVEVLHAVSLADTFWVKEKNDVENLKWCRVSPYTNPLDERIRRYAFNNVWDAKVAASRVTPEYSTDGTFAKCWQREGQKIYLCKYGTVGASNAGNEPYSEYYANQIECRLGIQRYVTYTLHTHKERVYTKCELFTTENLGLVSVDALLFEYNKTVCNYQDVYAFLRGLKIANIDEDFANMMVCDAIMLNVDRHLGNIGVLFDTDTLELKQLAPIYDNNLALLPYWNEKVESLDMYLKKHSTNDGTTDIVSKLGADFVQLGKQFLTKRLGRRLQDITMHGFEFTGAGSYNLSKMKLQALSELVVKQAQKILY